MITWKYRENKPEFGAFSITMNPEKQTMGTKRQRIIAWLDIFMKGTMTRKVHISMHSPLALLAIPSFDKHYPITTILFFLLIRDQSSTANRSKRRSWKINIYKSLKMVQITFEKVYQFQTWYSCLITVEQK